VFWGVIDRRMDTAFVRAAAERLPGGTLLFVGPQDNPDPELLRLPRVRTLPPVAYDDLPAVAARSAVLVMPYADLPVTRAMQPLKLKEYLATGKPVVASALPSTQSWADCLDLAATPDAFAAAVLARLARGLPAEQRAARSRLEAEGWDAKAEQFAGWLET
jgi:glycosyltransferase involved in cell wall biosynthesis